MASSTDRLAWLAECIVLTDDPRQRLQFEVIEAAEQRRQAEAEYYRMFPEAAAQIARGELHPFTDTTVNDALDALWAHVLGATS